MANGLIKTRQRTDKDFRPGSLRHDSRKGPKRRYTEETIDATETAKAVARRLKGGAEEAGRRVEGKVADVEKKLQAGTARIGEAAEHLKGKVSKTAKRAGKYLKEGGTPTGEMNTAAIRREIERLEKEYDPKKAERFGGKPGSRKSRQRSSHRAKQRRLERLSAVLVDREEQGAGFDEGVGKLAAEEEARWAKEQAGRKAQGIDLKRGDRRPPSNIYTTARDPLPDDDDSEALMQTDITSPVGNGRSAQINRLQDPRKAAPTVTPATQQAITGGGGAPVTARADATQASSSPNVLPPGASPPAEDPNRQRSVFEGPSGPATSPPALDQVVNGQMKVDQQPVPPTFADSRNPNYQLPGSGGRGPAAAPARESTETEKMFGRADFVEPGARESAATGDLAGPGDSRGTSPGGALPGEPSRRFGEGEALTVDDGLGDHVNNARGTIDRIDEIEDQQDLTTDERISAVLDGRTGAREFNGMKNGKPISYTIEVDSDGKVRATGIAKKNVLKQLRKDSESLLNIALGTDAGRGEDSSFWDRFREPDSAMSSWSPSLNPSALPPLLR